MAIPHDAQRRLIRTLAFAGREFDRARDTLLAEDEPTLPHAPETETGSAVPRDAPIPAESSGLAVRGRRVARAAASAAGGVARAAGRVVTGSVHPRHPDWPAASLDDRVEWWVDRFGTAAAALTAVPGAFGALSRVSGVGNVIGAAAQILMVNAVASEAGVSDPVRRIGAAAHIVLGREFDRSTIEAALAAPESEPAGLDGDGEEQVRGVRARLGRTARLVWRVARELWRLNADIDNRPQGGLVLRTMRNLPAVGAASAFVSERNGIARAAEQARAAFAPPDR